MDYLPWKTLPLSDISNIIASKVEFVFKAICIYSKIVLNLKRNKTFVKFMKNIPKNTQNLNCFCCFLEYLNIFAHKTLMLLWNYNKINFYLRNFGLILIMKLKISKHCCNCCKCHLKKLRRNVHQLLRTNYNKINHSYQQPA